MSMSAIEDTQTLSEWADAEARWHLKNVLLLKPSQLNFMVHATKFELLTTLPCCGWYTSSDSEIAWYYQLAT
jgi:hypothetical protein